MLPTSPKAGILRCASVTAPTDCMATCAAAANQDLGDMKLATVMAKVPTSRGQLHFAKGRKTSLCIGDGVLRFRGSMFVCMQGDLSNLPLVRLQEFYIGHTVEWTLATFWKLESTIQHS
jgi:hypothetical protein